MGICQTQDHRGKGQFSLQEKRKVIKDCLKWEKGEGRENQRRGKLWRRRWYKAVATWSRRQERSIGGGVAKGAF